MREKEPKVHDIFSHRRFMREWIAFMEDGIHRKPWSDTYKKSQLGYINRYFERYDVISADNLVDWYKTYFQDEFEAGKRETAAALPIQVTLKRHMQSCVSNFARFLYEQKGILTLDEYTKIKLLYPKKPPTYTPQIKTAPATMMPSSEMDSATGPDKLSASVCNGASQGRPVPPVVVAKA